MSATLQEESFQQYFSNCPVVYVAGRTFPVTIHYMEEIRQKLKNSRAIAATNSFSNTPTKFNNKGSGNVGVPEVIDYPKFDAEVVADVVCHIVSTNTTNKAPIPGLVVANQETIRKRGEAILIFLSGIQSIDKVHKALKARQILKSPSIKVCYFHYPLNHLFTCVFSKIHLLHGSLPPEQQRRVFKPTHPGEWKIVLATNIGKK